MVATDACEFHEHVLGYAFGVTNTLTVTTLACSGDSLCDIDSHATRESGVWLR